MASIMIRNLDDGIKHRLRVRAAEHGRSMEEEAREILREVVGDLRPPLNLAQSLRARVANVGGVDLDIPARDAMRAHATQLWINDHPGYQCPVGNPASGTGTARRDWLAAQDGATACLTAITEAELGRYSS